jgi:putative spermidine/putrescine transport system substrate-binding protein
MNRIKPETISTSRRRLMQGLAAGVAVSAFALPRFSRAAGPITVSNWGGDWNNRTVEFVEKPLLEDKGFTIIHDLGMEPERKAKLIAEKRIRRSSADIIHLNSSDAFEMKQQDAVATLDLARIPNYADVVEALRSDYFVPWLYSGVVIIYNKDKVKEPPKSYAELWDPKWAGRIGLTNQLYFNYMMMASLIKTGNLMDVPAGQDLLVSFAETIQPKIYAAHQQMAAGFANGEIDIAINYKARGLQWQADGLPLEIQYPAEGAIAVTFGACLPENAPNIEGAYAYLDAMLDPTAMAGLAEASFYAPASTKASLSDALRQKIDFSESERASLKFLDFRYVADHTVEWLEWWNKNVARG